MAVDCGGPGAARSGRHVPGGSHDQPFADLPEIGDADVGRSGVVETGRVQHLVDSRGHGHGRDLDRRRQTGSSIEFTDSVQGVGDVVDVAAGPHGVAAPG